VAGQDLGKENLKFLTESPNIKFGLGFQALILLDILVFLADFGWYMD
jgi:hypothetical protein